MSVEAITDAIHEYMYEKLNDSLETRREENPTCEETKNIQKNKQTVIPISENWIALDAAHRIGPGNTISRQEKMCKIRKSWTFCQMFHLDCLLKKFRKLYVGRGNNRCNT